MKTPSFCHIDWKTGGIVIGILSLIGSFPVSASGDVSVSLHFLIVSSCLLYGIYQEKSEFLLPYLVELVIILIQCVISFVCFALLKANGRDLENDIASNFFYERPKQFTREEKRFILCALAITSLVIVIFWLVIFALYRRMRYVPTADNQSK